MDFFTAFGVADYSSLNEILSLDTPTFICYWVKYAQVPPSSVVLTDKGHPRGQEEEEG